MNGPAMFMLVVLLAVHGSWCICSHACNVQGNDATTMATASSASPCGCSHGAEQPAPVESASDEDGSCCGCCLESPIAPPPVTAEASDLKLLSTTLCNLQTFEAAWKSSVWARGVLSPSVSDIAHIYPPLYLRLEVLRI